MNLCVCFYMLIAYSQVFYADFRFLFAGAFQIMYVCARYGKRIFFTHAHTIRSQEETQPLTTCTRIEMKPVADP